MKDRKLTLTVEELRLLTTLAMDQLFRREFIDPKMPGHRPNSREIDLGKELIARLRQVIDSGARRGEADGALEALLKE